MREEAIECIIAIVSVYFFAKDVEVKLRFAGVWVDNLMSNLWFFLGNL